MIMCDNPDVAPNNIILLAASKIPAEVTSNKQVNLWIISIKETQ